MRKSISFFINLKKIRMSNQFNQSNIPQESQQLEPTIQPEIPQKSGLSISAIISIIVIAVFIVGAAGYGTYRYFAPEQAKETTNSEEETDSGILPISDLTEETYEWMGGPGGGISSDKVTVGQIIPWPPTNISMIDEWKGEWETYNNILSGYSIQYPKGWTYREILSYDNLTTLALQPLGLEYEVINIIGNKGPSDFKDMSFDKYVKIAAQQNIQGYQKLHSIENVTTTNGIEGYKTHWYVEGFNGKRWISSPITYFESNLEGIKTIDVELTNTKYANYQKIYKQIVNSFNLIETGPEITDWNIYKKDGDYKYEIKYPKTWSLFGPPVIPPGKVIVFISPDESSRIVITIEDSNGLSLEEFATAYPKPKDKVKVVSQNFIHIGLLQNNFTLTQRDYSLDTGIQQLVEAFVKPAKGEEYTESGTYIYFSRPDNDYIYVIHDSSQISLSVFKEIISSLRWNE